MDDPTPTDVIAFWCDAGPDAWYKTDPDFDRTIIDRFGALWHTARDGGLSDWCDTARGALAFIIVTDQFPRNMFRGDAWSFATDDLAKSAAQVALDRGWDRDIPEPERQFFYMPFMHSEDLADQDRCVTLMAERMETGNNLLHARAHREIIRRYARFPYRNAALGRDATPAEQAFLDGGGYGRIVADLEADDR